MRTILIVDDNDGHALLTREALSGTFNVDEIIHLQSGKEALEYLNKSGKWEGREGSNPNLILLDINMPQVDGYTLLHRIKTTESFKRIPVIMLSLCNSASDIDKCYELGANAYMLKQFDYMQYQEQIKALGKFWGNANISPTLSPPQADA